MLTTRRVIAATLTLIGLGALSPLAGMAPAKARAERPALAEALSLPDMALGPADARVTIVEYASLTCPHCAAFNREVFPKLKAAYIDTGKVRYVFREFARDPKDAAGAMLARGISGDDCGK